MAFAGIVAATRSIPLAEEEAARFITFEDEFGLVEARLAPDAYQRLRPVITTPGPFLVRGKVRRQQDVISIGVEDLLPFYQRRVRGSAPVPDSGG